MQLPSACILKPVAGAIKTLMAFRERLTKTKVSLKQTLQDLKDTASLVDNQFIMRGAAPKQSEKQLKLIEQQIDHTNQQMEATLQENEQVQDRFRLISSVVGIGRPPRG